MKIWKTLITCTTFSIMSLTSTLFAINQSEWETFKGASLAADIYENKGGKAIGSGVVIAGGKLLTAGHCHGTAMLVFRNEGGEKWKAKLENIDCILDAGLYNLEGTNIPKGVPLGDSSKLKFGDKLYQIGNGVNYDKNNPQPRWFHKSAGTFIRLEENQEGEPRIQFTVRIMPGDSGSGVVNEQGELVGVVSQQMVDYQTGEIIGLAVPINDIKKTFGLGNDAS